MHEVISKARIEREAKAAAAAGQSINYSCPYPFGSEAATHFKAVYLLALPARKAAALEPTEVTT